MGHLRIGGDESLPSASSGQDLSTAHPTAAPSGQDLATGGVGEELPDSELNRIVEQVAAASLSASPSRSNNVPPPPSYPPPQVSPAAHLAGLALEQSSVPVSSKVVDPTNDNEVTPIRMVQSARSHRFSDSFINDVYKTVNTQGVICLLYTSPSPRDKRQSRMPSSA